MAQGKKPSTPAAKERNARNWERSHDRRKRRHAVQVATARANKASPPSPWQEACAARRERHLEDKKAGRWQPVERNPSGFIRRSDGKRTWWEDPGAKERKHYLATVKQ